MSIPDIKSNGDQFLWMVTATYMGAIDTTYHLNEEEARQRANLHRGVVLGIHSVVIPAPLEVTSQMIRATIDKRCEMIDALLIHENNKHTREYYQELAES